MGQKVRVHRAGKVGGHKLKVLNPIYKSFFAGKPILSYYFHIKGVSSFFVFCSSVLETISCSHAVGFFF